MRDEQKRRPRYHRLTPEQEEARLRKQFANMYLELQITDNTDGGQLLASRLISLAEEQEVVLAFFNGECVPLTMRLDEKPYYSHEKIDISYSATLLRLGLQPEILMLARGDKVEEVGDWQDEPDGSKATIWFEGEDGPNLTEYSQLCMWWLISCNVHQTTHEAKGLWEMGMSLSIDFSGAYADGYFTFNSVTHVLAFLDFLCKGQAVWRLPQGVDMPAASDDPDTSDATLVTPSPTTNTSSSSFFFAPISTATTAVRDVVEAVLFEQPLLPAILSSLDLPAVAAVAAACRPARDIVASSTIWESWLRCHFPASALLIATIRVSCGSARAFCRLRTEALGLKPLWRPSKASEEARLRRALA